MQKKIIVVKIGSSVLFTARGKLDEFRVLCLLDQIISLRKKGFSLILVVSGAMACGMNFIQTNILYYTRGRESNRVYSGLSKEVIAGIGQTILVSKLSHLFYQKKCTIAQLLLTRDELKLRNKSFMQTLRNMRITGIIPVINENDVIDLNSFGGNDILAAKISEMMQARLVILSTWKASTYGVGGAVTKFEAVRYLRRRGLNAVIQDGKEQDCLLTSITKI